MALLVFAAEQSPFKTKMNHWQLTSTSTGEKLLVFQKRTFQGFGRPVDWPKMSEAFFRKMGLRSMPPPAWLSEDAPNGDIVLSTRTRVMRNLRGHRFTHAAERAELLQISANILKATEGLGLETFKLISQIERDYLVAARLASPHLQWNKPGRALLLDKTRHLSLMVHEEDHLRLQALTAGWTPENSNGIAEQALRDLGRNLEFASSDRFGFLAASPFNAGRGRRLSAMFHLIGLAQVKRLPGVLRALGERGIAARGLFGESSRAIGAFVQVSVTGGAKHDFTGACEYLLHEERSARSEIGRGALADKAKQVAEFALESNSFSLGDALRVIAWIRWASQYGIEGFPSSPRAADFALTLLHLNENDEDQRAASLRSGLIRHLLVPNPQQV